jgi:predicted glutamine amidotransferase
MCGLFGVLNFNHLGVYNQDYTVFKELMIASALRGIDGTGVIYIGDENTKLCEQGSTYGWIKSPEDSLSFLSNKLWSDTKEQIIKSRFLLGHVRAATRGKNTIENTHPFDVGEIILLHNGTISGIESYKDFKIHEVDSEAIAHALNLTQDPADTLEWIDGAAALTWYNSRTESVHFWRNYQRPLFAVQTGTCIYYASESKMLYWILDRNRIPIIGGSVVEIQPETLYTWSHNNITPTVRNVRRRYVKQLPYVSPVVTDLPNSSPSADVVTLEKGTESVKTYYNLHVGDKLVWSPSNIEELGKHTRITGDIWSIRNDDPEKNLVILDNALVVTIIRNDHVLGKALYDSALLEGIITNITINLNDFTDVRVFVTSVTAVDPAKSGEIQPKKETIN